MSKLFASDSGRLRLVGGQEANTNQAEDPQNSTFARLYRTESATERFVGRKEELSKLKRGFDMAIAGHGKPVFVIGDPGIGKTELVRQFFIRLRDTAKITLSGRYFDVGSGAPYKVFLDGFYDILRYTERAPGSGPLGAREVEMLKNSLKEIREVSNTLGMQGADGERIKYRTFELLAHGYRLLVNAQPVILSLDDLQWADELSLEFLAYLIRALQGERFFIACTVREHEITSDENNPLRIWMRRMSRYNAYEQIKMQPLTEAETEALIDSIFPVHAFTENLVQLLRKETGGNPYYILEVVKQLIEDQKIFWNGERWECHSIAEVKLPKSLVDLTELHLSRLDQDTLTIFQQAAVIGEEFSFTLLQAVTELGERELISAIETGIREFLIREEPRTLSNESERYTFYYNTTRKVLYEKLSSRQRRLIHLKAAEILDANGRRSPDRNAGELAYHYYHAGEMVRAFHWLVEAGTIACQRFAFDRAKEFFDWAAKALATLQEANQVPVPQLLAKYYYISGQLHSALGEYEKAVEFMRQAQLVCRELGEKQKEAEVLLLIGNTLKQATHFSEALEAYNTALRLAAELKAPKLTWPAAQGAARCEIELGHAQAAAELLRAGLAIIDGLINSTTGSEQEQLTNARMEMEALLCEVEEKLANSVSERHSGSFPALNEQVMQPSTPEKASRVVEVMHAPMETFKQYALWFKQLHGTNEILNKLSKSQLEPPRVVGLIFSGLKQLKGRINELDPISVNSQLSLVEKQLQEYQRWLQQVNNMLPPFTMRQYLDRGMLNQEEMLQLARFMVMVQSDSEDDKGKVELLLTRALELEVERHHIITGLFPLDMIFTPLAETNPQKQALQAILAEIDGFTEYPDLIASNITVRIRQVKGDFGQLFWHPEILTDIIEIDLKLDLRLKELLEKEQRDTSAICDQLLANGVKMIPRRGQAGALDVEAARRMAQRARDLLNSNYESNRAGLTMLAEVSRFLKAYLQENRLLMGGAVPIDNPFVDTPVSQPQALPAPVTPPPVASQNVSAPPVATPPVNPAETPRPTQQRPESFSGAFTRPFITGPEAGATEPAAQPAARAGAGSNEQIEAKLQSRLAEICILLATKLRDVPVKVLQLKRSQLAIASWEVDALLSSDDEPAEPQVAKQNHLIRRSIALLAEMQEIGISCRELLAAGQRSEAEAALKMAEYFLEQAKAAAGELETHSHRERDGGQFAKAQNLAATRQKLMSTHQLLSTLIGWLKREMDK